MVHRICQQLQQCQEAKLNSEFQVYCDQCARELLQQADLESDADRGKPTNKKAKKKAKARAKAVDKSHEQHGPVANVVATADSTLVPAKTSGGRASTPGG